MRVTVRYVVGNHFAEDIYEDVEDYSLDGGTTFQHVLYRKYGRVTYITNAVAINYNHYEDEAPPW